MNGVLVNVFSANNVRLGLKKKSLGKWKWEDESVLTTAKWSEGHPDDEAKCAKSEEEDNFLEWKGTPCNVELSVACFNLGL